MFKSLINCKLNFPKFNLAKNLPEGPWLCSQTPGKVTAKFISVKFFTMSQSFSMKTRFVLESTYGITHYVRSIPITLSVYVEE